MTLRAGAVGDREGGWHDADRRGDPWVEEESDHISRVTLSRNTHITFPPHGARICYCGYVRVYIGICILSDKNAISLQTPNTTYHT